MPRRWSQGGRIRHDFLHFPHGRRTVPTQLHRLRGWTAAATGEHGYLPYPGGRELSGYQVGDLTARRWLPGSPQIDLRHSCNFMAAISCKHAVKSN